MDRVRPESERHQLGALIRTIHANGCGMPQNVLAYGVEQSMTDSFAEPPRIVEEVTQVIHTQRGAEAFGQDMADCAGAEWILRHDHVRATASHQTGARSVTIPGGGRACGRWDG